MNKRAIARTTIVLALIVVIFAAGLIYYATLPAPKVPVATITGKVTDAKTGGPVAGAAVTADGYGTTTGSDGAYSLSVKLGKYTVKVVTTGYEAKTASVDAAEEKTYAVNVPITPLPPPPPGPATVTGKVTDAKTGAAVAGATVTLDGLKYITGPDGTYSFSVKVGKYTVTVSMTGYETKTASVDASAEKTYTVNVSIPPIPPPPPVAPDFVKTNTYVYEGTPVFQWLDPHVSYYMFDYWVLQQCVEQLVWYNGTDPIRCIPWLAESYKPTKPDLTQYEFKLRKGIYFQDGTPLNSTAVWFSMNRVLVIDGTSATGVHGSQAAWIIQQMLDKSLSSCLSGVDQPYDEAWVKKVLDQKFIEIVDDYTFRMNIIHPTTSFEYLLSMAWAAIISPTSTIAGDYEYHKWGKWDGNYTKYFVHMAGVGDTAFNVPEKGWKIGTGPYILESVDPTTYRIVMKAYPKYWGGPPGFAYPIKQKITTIEYLYQPSLATRLLDFKAGKVTRISVAPLDIFSVADRGKWINEAKLVSIIPGATIWGPWMEPVTVWFNYNTNVTDAAGRFKKFQPMADWRFRMAMACAVNMTDMNIYVNNRLGVEALNLIPPGTAPEGSYNPNIKPVYSFNLTKAEELLKDLWNNPMTSATHEMYYYNGTRIPPGVVDNSWGPDNPQTIECYVPAGATHYERVLTTITENLNAIIWRNRPMRGLTFQVVPVPGGQQYTLASMHRIYMYWGGWHADYNHVLNWLGPMYLSTGTYFSWNLWNITRLDQLFNEAVEADARGDMKRLLEINNEANKLANEMILYLYLWHPMIYFVESSWLKDLYYNLAIAYEYVASMSYEAP